MSNLMAFFVSTKLNYKANMVDKTERTPLPNFNVQKKPVCDTVNRIARGVDHWQTISRYDSLTT